MGTPIISLPPNFVASTTQVMGQITTDLHDYIILIVGVLLTMLAITILISALHSNK